MSTTDRDPGFQVVDVGAAHVEALAPAGVGVDLELEAWSSTSPCTEVL